jgi:uncharacterized protein YjiS (DUF1127 family)
MEIPVMATLWNTVSVGTPVLSEGVMKPDRLARIIGWFKTRHARRVALWELQSLDERTLQDLRISQYDFNEIANGTYRR